MFDKFTLKSVVILYNNKRFINKPIKFEIFLLVNGKLYIGKIGYSLRRYCLSIMH